ncbi:unnamed protein product [Microthlaspi erraticum]|uniref:F-box domain-containing protein n=1 Tax=Microthlaspi erraticum TaxID=1685480 RepID=A0A6D2KPM5_9BRAS|nr:unnamed protein product [Microthlaspi erraticum]
MSSPPHRSFGGEPMIEKTKRKRKRKKPSPVLPQTLQSTPVPSLPDDLLLSSFARISRLHYPALSLVSKTFRSLLTSPELYETRSLLGRTESCLYLCLKPTTDPFPIRRWFTLCRKPNRTLTTGNTREKKKKKKKQTLTNGYTTEKKKKVNSSGNILIPVSFPNSPQVHWQSVVAVGSCIYVIGGPINDSYSSDLWVQFHVWRKGPSMSAERYYPAVDVVDGKIYVVGGGYDLDASNWMEVFDPKTQTWECVVCPHAERFSRSVDRSAVVEGRIFYMFFMEGMSYDPKEDRWEAMKMMANMDSGWPWLSYCVVDDVLFACCDSEGLRWYDFKKQSWMEMKSLKGLPEFARYCHYQMADYGGKLAVFWKKSVGVKGINKSKKIRCAVIAIEKRNGGEEVWGTVEWHDLVLTLPESFELVHALSAAV